MRSFILFGLICFAVSSIASRDYRHEQFYRRYKGAKNKRGIADYPSYSFSTPSYSSAHSGIQVIPASHSSQHFGGHGGSLNLASSGYSSGGIGRGIQSLNTHGNSIDHNAANSIPLHGINVALGGQEMKQILQGIQATYPINMVNLGHDSIGLFTSAMKTGPVTFGMSHGGNRGAAAVMPLFVTATQNTGTNNIGSHRGYRIPAVLGSSSATGSPHTVSGGYAMAIPSQSSTAGYGHITPLGTASEASGYSLPGSSVSYPSPSNHIGLSSGSSDSSSYQLPISTISYPVSSYSSGSYPKYTPASSSGSTYLAGGGANTPGKASSISASSFSYPSSSSGSSISSYASSGASYGTSSPSHQSPSATYGSISSSQSSSHSPYASISSSQSSSHSPYASYSLSQSTPSASYGNPSTSYSSPSSVYSTFNYRSHPAMNYASHSSYEAPSASASSNNLNYHSSSSGSSYANPSSLYSSGSYSSPSLSSSYSSPSGSYSSNYEDSTGTGAQSETTGSYSNLAPQYLSYPAGKSFENIYADSTNYDTISYSSPSGKY